MRDRLRHTARFRNSNVDKKSWPDEERILLCNYTDVYHNETISDPDDFMTATATPSEIERFTLREDQVLITKDSETPDDIGIPAFVREDMPGVVLGYHTTQLTPGGRMHGRYLFWWLMSYPSRSWFEISARGVTRFSLDQDAIGDLPIRVPALPEQRKTADFLDRETERIDALVDRKRRLLDLLEEKRTATITQAVTKGLNPTVPMKDSNIPWIGEIPEGWDAARLKSLCLEPLKYGANESAVEANPQHPRYIRTTDVRPDGSLRQDTYRSLPPETAQPYMLADKDLLFTRSGATVGKSFMYERAWGPACFAGYLIRVRPNPEFVAPQFVSYFAQSETYWRQIEAAAIQATIKNVSAERYGELRIPLPQVDEQDVIAIALREMDERVRQLKRSITTQLTLLAEYREALITAAVTGEIDVETFDSDRHREEATA